MGTHRRRRPLRPRGLHQHPPRKHSLPRKSPRAPTVVRDREQGGEVQYIQHLDRERDGRGTQVLGEGQGGRAVVRGRGKWCKEEGEPGAQGEDQGEEEERRKFGKGESLKQHYVNWIWCWRRRGDSRRTRGHQC